MQVTQGKDNSEYLLGLIMTQTPMNPLIGLYNYVTEQYLKDKANNIQMSKQKERENG